MLKVLIVLYILLVFFTFFDYIKLVAKVKLSIAILLYFILALICGLRFGDRDYGVYMASFDQAPNWGESAMNMEPNYRYLAYGFKMLGFSWEFFVLFFAFFSVGLMFLFLKKYTPFIFLAVLIYFSHAFILRDMMQIRSSLAIGIVMFSIPYIENRNFLKTLFIVLFSGLFHFVGYFFIIIYFLYPWFSIKRAIYVLLIGMIIGGVLNQTFFEYILEITNLQIIYYYLNDELYNYNLGLLNPVLIKHILVIVVLLINYDFFKQKVPCFDVMITSYLVAFFCLSAFNSFALLAGRIGTLFSNVEHVLIPSLFFLKYKRITLFLIIAYSFVAFHAKWEDLSLVQFVFDK
ncbi:EpsG family protein [Flavobacterium gyeonganense]|uniref:EpsG family protein n=1 Tax=Flavobacterium gyeonganense TaxID=1310418 RepID=A0ABV5H7X1_9FLAO|nr:EpsG family protein [Flavobacterium gyeonganense]